ncbi:MAG: hypothetical protein PGN22_05090 [Agrobacterium cavarae]
MSLIHNERTKLAANALDRLSTAFLAVGVIGKTINSVPDATDWVSYLGVVTWTIGAIALHFLARHVLGRLKP